MCVDIQQDSATGTTRNIDILSPEGMDAFVANLSQRDAWLLWAALDNGSRRVKDIMMRALQARGQDR